MQKSQSELIAKLMLEFQNKSQELAKSIESEIAVSMKEKQEKMDAEILAYKTSISELKEQGSKSEDAMGKKMDVIISVIQNAMTQLAQMNPNLTYQVSKNEDMKFKQTSFDLANNPLVSSQIDEDI